MAAAFQIDCELEPAGQAYKVHCTGMRNTWVVQGAKVRAPSDFENLERTLQDDKELENVQLPRLTGTDVENLEEFLNKLIANPLILRNTALHEFLDVPAQMRESFSFATARKDGAQIHQGTLTKHYRVVKRPGTARFFKLFEEPRGGTLKYFANEHANQPMGAIRLSSNAEVSRLGADKVPNGFVIKSGDRQWVLQAAKETELHAWLDKLDDRIKSAGGGRRKDAPAAATAAGGATTRNNRREAATDQKEDLEVTQLKQELEQYKTRSELLQGENKDLKKQIDELRQSLKGSDETMNKEMEKLRAKMREDQNERQEQWDQIHKNLRNEIEALQRKIDAQPTLGEGKKGLLGFLGDGYTEDDGKDDEVTNAVESATEQAKMSELTADERRQIKFFHRHWHKHNHKHIHVHRHQHVHVEDENGAVQTYSSTHTFSHTLTHTSSEMKVKRPKFFKT